MAIPGIARETMEIDDFIRAESLDETLSCSDEIQKLQDENSGKNEKTDKILRNNIDEM